MSENILNNTYAAIDAGMTIGSLPAIKIDEYKKGVRVPKDYDLKVFEQRRPNPEFIQQAVSLETAESFIDYFNRFCTKSSIITCDIKKGQFSGYIDYHTPEQAAWKDHTCNFECKTTPEWNDWKSRSGMAMDQEKFAYFIEDHAEEIINPSSADMMEIALSLRAKKNINFNSGIRLHNGQVQLQYTETIKGEAGVKGQLEIPEIIDIGVKLFEGGSAYKMQARFRYRIKEGHLAMWYELIRPHKTHEAAVNDAFNLIKEKANCELIIHGEVK